MQRVQLPLRRAFFNKDIEITPYGVIDEQMHAQDGRIESTDDGPIQTAPYTSGLRTSNDASDARETTKPARFSPCR